MSRRLTSLSFAVATLITAWAAPALATPPDVLHSLAQGEGRRPNCGLGQDAAGNLYGTAAAGGPANAGTVYELTPPTTPGGAWGFADIHVFVGVDGYIPDSAPIVDAQGNLYGTTAYGGTNGAAPGAGVVWRLRHVDGAWIGQVLYDFGATPTDGMVPQARLLLGPSGELYGTTTGGGTAGQGTVFMLTPKAHGGGWAETVLYNFAGGAADGAIPVAGLYRDTQGRLFGTTAAGGSGAAPGNGTVYMLTPTQAGGYTEQVIHFFAGDATDGAGSFSQPIENAGGTLYGTTSAGGAQGLGTVWALIPQAGGGWAEQTLVNLDAAIGAESFSGLAADPAGQLFGTALYGGSNNLGTVFRVTPPPPGGHWTARAVHTFHGLNGAFPYATPIIDASGALYGTTYAGGDPDFGVIFGPTQP